MTASRKSTSSGGSVARSAIERAEERGIFAMAERCMRVLGGVEDMTHMRHKTTGVHDVCSERHDKLGKRDLYTLTGEDRTKARTVEKMGDEISWTPPGPPKVPGKVGYRFWSFWALMGGPKSTQIGCLMGGLGTRHPKKATDGWTSVPNL